METRNWIKEFDDKFKGRVIDGWNPEGGDGMYLNKDGSSTPLQPELKNSYNHCFQLTQDTALPINTF